MGKTLTDQIVYSMRTEPEKWRGDAYATHNEDFLGTGRDASIWVGNGVFFIGPWKYTQEGRYINDNVVTAGLGIWSKWRMWRAYKKISNVPIEVFENDIDDEIEDEIRRILDE